MLERLVNVIMDYETDVLDDETRLEFAKDILQELLEPTDKMIEAGHTVTGKWWDIKGSGLTIKRVKMKMRWQGMIKEALKDE